MAVNIKLKFDDTFNADLEGARAKTPIGITGESFVPYELLYGALGSCVHSTFMGIAKKMRLTYTNMNYEITGEKRNEIPAFLKDVWMKITVENASDEAKMTKAINLGTEYCSIFNTLKKVAEMHVEIEYK